MRTLADVLDGFAAVMAVLAVVFFFWSMTMTDTGPELMQIGLVTLLIAVVPYCLAGAVSRMVSRIDRPD